MARLTELTLIDLLSAFQSSEPTPGGGSASALTGAVGASLLVMVSGLPRPRATTEEDLERLQAAKTQCVRLSERLTVLVDQDSEAYAMVVAAYRQPKATDAEKKARTDAIQRALRAAIDAPLEVMRACAGAAEQGVVVAELGNRNAASDVQVGLELLLAGLRGARLNIEINLGMVKDAAYVAAVGEASSRFASDAHASLVAARTPLQTEA